MGIDLGTKRVGVAVSDAGGVLASPVEVLERTRDRRGDHRRLAELIAEWEVDRVVVGLPLSLDGGTGPAARLVLDEVAEMARHLPVPVETYDERLTTVQAHALLAAQDRSARQRRSVVDKVAAAVLLQAWIDHHRNRQEDDDDHR